MKINIIRSFMIGLFVDIVKSSPWFPPIYCRARSNRETDEQVIGILKEQEAGHRSVDVCRKHGLSEDTFYEWKAKFGGLQVSDAKRLHALEAEYAQ